MTAQCMGSACTVAYEARARGRVLGQWPLRLMFSTSLFVVKNLECCLSLCVKLYFRGIWKVGVERNYRKHGFMKCVKTCPSNCLLNDRASISSPDQHHFCQACPLPAIFLAKINKRHCAGLSTSPYYILQIKKYTSIIPLLTHAF